jgi:hypothetical protein
MKNWFSRNYRTIIITAFLIPIITVAIVSISHVTMWYGLSNPVSWSLYLSIGIEIAALSALAAISANMGSKVYFPFIVVTLIQFIGNIFFAYSYIDINSKTFTDWVDLVSPLLEFMGVESDDLVSHKRFLSLFAGGMLPIISLSFLHMLVKFTEEDRLKEEKLVETEHQKLVDDHIIEGEIEKYKKEHEQVNASDIISEVSRIRLNNDDLEKLEKILTNPPTPNEGIKEPINSYQEKVENRESIINIDESPNPTEPQIETVKEDEEVEEEKDEGGSSGEHNIDNSDPSNDDQPIIEPELEEEKIDETSEKNDDLEKKN